jgi:hypothetical protein
MNVPAVSFRLAAGQFCVWWSALVAGRIGRIPRLKNVTQVHDAAAAIANCDATFCNYPEQGTRLGSPVSLSAFVSMNASGDDFLMNLGMNGSKAGANC